MSDMDNAKAKILAAADKTEEAAGAALMAVETVQEALNLMRDAVGDTNRQDLIEASGMAAQFQMELNDASVTGMGAATAMRDSTLLM